MGLFFANICLTLNVYRIKYLDNIGALKRIPGIAIKEILMATKRKAKKKATKKKAKRKAPKRKAAKKKAPKRKAKKKAKKKAKRRKR